MYTSSKGVNFCIIRSGAVLLQQRDEYCPHFPLMWCIPGGASEPTETGRQTAVREMAEEYEIQVQEDDLVWLTHRPATNPGDVYVVEVSSATKAIMHEGKDMQWVELKELELLELGFNQSTFITPALLSHYCML